MPQNTVPGINNQDGNSDESSAIFVKRVFLSASEFEFTSYRLKTLCNNTVCRSVMSKVLTGMESTSLLKQRRSVETTTKSQTIKFRLVLQVVLAAGMKFQDASVNLVKGGLLLRKDGHNMRVETYKELGRH
eukprot:GILJ01022259.1.p1 GENE.GILJ01022259.1~~GILJ01022259.1.p1  ORF type:complete len:131 (+),score=16.61 GILJ01022259.1:439-831(+)